MRHGEAKPRGGAIVKDIQRIALQAQRLSKLPDRLRQCVEAVHIFALVWNFREPKSREVWGDYSITIRQPRNELSVLKRRRGKSMKQKHDRRIGWSGFTIEHSHSICLDAANRSLWPARSLFLCVLGYLRIHCYICRFHRGEEDVESFCHGGV